MFTRDGSARITYELITGCPQNKRVTTTSSVVAVDKGGRISTSTVSGTAAVLVTVHEEFGTNQTALVHVEVHISSNVNWHLLDTKKHWMGFLCQKFDWKLLFVSGQGCVVTLHHVSVTCACDIRQTAFISSWNECIIRGCSPWQHWKGVPLGRDTTEIPVKQVCCWLLPLLLPHNKGRKILHNFFKFLSMMSKLWLL